MLKKGDHFLNNLNITKKNKLYTQPNESYSQFNKENVASKSLFEQLNDSNLNQHALKQKPYDQSTYGSAMISPTFQSPDLVNLKDDRFRQDKAYLNINFSLKDMEKTSKDTHKNNHHKPTEQTHNTNQEKYAVELREVEELKKRLQQHYSKKKYWKKIEALFEQEGVNGVLAWEDAIEKYKAVKASNQQLFDQNRRLLNQIAAKEERVAQIQKQLAQDKNQTKVISQKKCKGCETLEQKQKEYFQLYEQSKKSSKQLQEIKENLTQTSQQCKKIDEKYKNLVFLKEEVDKKNAKLLQKQKDLSSQLQRMQKTLKEVKGESSNSKDLHIEIEQLKETKYQMQKTISKLQQKYRRQISDLKLDINGVQQEKNILLAQSQKTKLELSQTKSKLYKIQFEVSSIDEELKMKNIECQDLKRRHLQKMSEELIKRNEMQTKIKKQVEEVEQLSHLADELESAKLHYERQLQEEQKASSAKGQELAKQISNGKHLEEKLRDTEEKLAEIQDKLRQMQGSEHRIKEANQVFTAMRSKNNYQGNHQSTSPQASSLLLRVCNKIKELHYSLAQITQEVPDSYQKRRNKQDLSQQRQQINLLKTERYVNQLITELSNVRNKYEFIHNENETLKVQLQNENAYKQQLLDQMERQVEFKDEVIRYINSCIPEELKEIVLEFLFMTEQILKDQHQEDLDQYDDLKQALEGQAKEWKDNYNRRWKKMEEEIRRLEDQNDDLKRRFKVKDTKRPMQGEYEHRDINKKDIRKKYNLQN